MYSLKCNDHYCELVHYYKNQKKQSLNDDYIRNYQYESAARAKNTIIDYVKNNDFNFLLTITFDQKKVDRYNYQYLKKRVTKFLNHYKDRYDPNFKYILTAEKHKKKNYEDKAALHFHAIVKMQKQFMHYLPNESKKRSDNDYSVRVYRHKKLTESFGKMNDCVELYNKKEFVAYYISKYITKQYELILDHYYYKSNGLKKSEIIFKQESIKHLPPQKTFSSDYIDKYRIEHEELHDFLNKNDIF